MLRIMGWSEVTTRSHEVWSLGLASGIEKAEGVSSHASCTPDPSRFPPSGLPRPSSLERTSPSPLPPAVRLRWLHIVGCRRDGVWCSLPWVELIADIVGCRLL